MCVLKVFASEDTQSHRLHLFARISEAAALAVLLRSALRSSPLPDSGTGSPRADFVITYSAGSEGPVPTRHCPATPRRGRGRPPGGESWNPGILEILECGSSPEEEGESSPGCCCSRSVSWGFVMGHWVTTFSFMSPHVPPLPTDCLLCSSVVCMALKTTARLLPLQI